MLVERLVDVARIDVEAAGDDHVLLAVHDVEIAVRVHRGDVAGVAPAVAERVGRLLGPVLVPFHHLGPLDDEFAALAGRHVLHAVVQIDDAAERVGDRHAHAAHLAGAARKGVDVRHRRRLRHAEPLDDRRPRDLLEIVDHLHRQRRASGEGALDAAHVGFFEFGVIQHADVHGGHERRKGRAELGDRLEERFRLRLGDQDLRPSHEDREIHGNGKPEDVEIGKRAQHDLGRVGKGREPRLELLDLFAEVPVRQHDALGDARGSSRVLVHGHVVEGQGCLCGRCAGPGQAFLPPVDVRRGLHVGGQFLLLGHQGKEQALGEGQVIADGGVDDLLDLGLGPEVDHPVAEQIERDEHLGAGIVELVLEFGIGIQGVVHHGDGAELEDGEVGGDAGDQVRQQDGDGVALPDAEPAEAGGKAVHHVLELGVIDLKSLEDEGGPVCMRLGRPFQDVGQADLLVLNGFGDPFFIRLQPRFVLIRNVCRHTAEPSFPASCNAFPPDASMATATP
ncbi:MAG: hypothetical protein A4E73_00360 [Syntrophaceae bacterium PtaU1.Bin231]|nr:MAG: hypothetical protein A4E73_00360 [Syntrophaceae bacterium PtaU1.Bin231]